LSEQGPAPIAEGQPITGEATSNFQERSQIRLSPAADEAEDRIQRAAIVGQLAGGILHDFNNVLTVITGMIDILAAAVADDPQLAAVAKLIDEAATRGAALTAHLLAFARGRPSQPHQVDVNALLGEAVRLLRPALGGIEVHIAAATETPPVLVDRTQLMAAILSLAIAARNAMPEGGRLIFHAGAAGRGTRSSARDEEATVITLDAHGYGEVAEHPERIFSDTGTAADFVTQCGGRLEFCAASNEYARVEILLPKGAADAAWLADS
jgi:signal transduction histidine kinase